LHYALLERIKPNGKPYMNTEKDWTWLQEHAGKAARWLGYIPFDRIVDQRNAEPVVRIFRPPGRPWPYLTVGLDVEIPDSDDLVPRIGIDNFEAAQPYKLVFFGEKSSLADVLGPLATRRQADLYLPTGEISDTLLYQMARIGAEDGRPMMVFTFSDCDPAGWQMPISIGRKLMALRDGWFPDLTFEVRRVGLTPDHVRAYGLPSTPLKDTELRADKWRDAMGVQQTEIDALASLRPELLERIALEAVAPFYDETLDRRVVQARAAWVEEAQEIVDESMGTELGRIRAEAAEKLETMRAEIDAINQALQIDADDFDLPEAHVPRPLLGETPNGKPLVDSRWSFLEQTRSLRRSKAYASDEGDG
jgi:hypothetical protein